MIPPRLRSWRILLTAALWLAAVDPARAEAVRVQSGEHDGFTRIVLDFGEPQDWTLGRVGTGYGLRIAGPSPGYDLTEVFRRIGKSRIGALWADPETGDLILTAACACHAIPFEFRPGVVVIDLKDGAPPKGSSFETALEGESVTEAAATPVPRPRPRPAQQGEAVAGFDWTETLVQPPARTPEPEAPPPPGEVQTPTQSERAEARIDELAEFGEGLRRELAQAASRGLIDMAPPEADTGPSLPPDIPDQIRIGNRGRASDTPEGAPDPGLTAKGADCIPAEQLDLAAWGDGTRPIAEQLAEQRTDLVGEFDSPNPDQVGKAARFYLFLGFGAEAVSVLQAFPGEKDAELLTTLARIIDGGPPGDRFAGMEACQGPAALWSLLDGGRIADVSDQGTRPILLAFSALPPHLRRHLAPRLTEIFLNAGLAEAAHAVSGAVDRPGPSADGDTAIMSVRLMISQGETAKAESLLRERIATAGPDLAEAYFTLAELAAAQRKPLSPEEADAIEALAEEQPDGPLALQGEKARLLARAASGSFAPAFADGHPPEELAADIWGLLAQLGTDDDILSYAVLARGKRPAGASAEDAATIASRLLDLGLARPALSWLESAGQMESLVAARALLAEGDAVRAATILTNLPADTPERADLLFQAEMASAAYDKAEKLLPPEDDRRAPTLARSRDWTGIAEQADGPWATLATEALGKDQATPPKEGPLAVGTALAESSAATRGMVQELLASLEKPAATP